MNKMSENNDWRDWLKHILDEVRSLREDQKEVIEEQKSIGKVLTANTVSLEEHIRRTDLLEDALKEIREDRKKSLEAWDTRIKPLEKQSLFISAYWKMALLIISVLTSEAFITAWHFLSEIINHAK